MRTNPKGIHSEKILYFLVVFIFHFSFLINAQAPSWAIGIQLPYHVVIVNSIVPTKDGGYFVGGNFEINIHTEGGTYVAKLDSEGNLQWASALLNYCNAVIQADDGGFATVGYPDWALGSEDVYITKLDSVGNTQWTQTIGGIDDDAGYSIAVTKDGGYVVTGISSSYGLGSNIGYTETGGIVVNNDAYVIKLDSGGNVQWTKTIGGAGDDQGYAVIQTKDNGYAITGETNSYGAGGYDVYVIKLDSTGNLQWTKTIGGRKNDYGNSIIQSRDGGYAITGVTYSFADTVNGDVYIIKLDSAGDLQWTTTVGGTGTDVGQSILQTNNGGYLIAGTTNSYGGGGTIVYSIKLDSVGNLTETRTISASANAGIQFVSETPTGGFAVAGNILDGEFYVLVLDSTGDNCSTNGSGGIYDSGGTVSSGGTITSTDSGRIVRGGPSLSGISGSVAYICGQNSGGLSITPVIGNAECLNYPDGSISLTVSGGISPYTYNWSPPVSDSSSITGISGGTFTITVTDSIKDSVTIVIPMPFYSDVDFLTNVTNTTCKGNGSITLTNLSGTEPFTYSWSNGGTSIADSGLSAGIYTVSVSDSCGDVTTASVTVMQTPDLSDSASVISNISCYNDSNGIATVTVSAGTPPFTYLWSDVNSQATATATGLKAGIYSITVTDTCGGLATSSITITQPAAWQVNISSSTNVSCFGGSNCSAVSRLTVPLVAYYSFEAAVQHFPVPPGVTTVTISISGAHGGGSLGGIGATFTGVCSVIPGDILSVVVGEEGGIFARAYGGSAYGGGGGASWVYDSNIVLYNPAGTTGLLAVAAGGGGGGSYVNVNGDGGFWYGGAGGVNLSTNETTAGTYGDAVGGTGGNGGNALNGGAGAGWLTNGAIGFENLCGGHDTGGMDESNHFSMIHEFFGGYGGFGGGGSAGQCGAMGSRINGGGGGGYNGGGTDAGGGGGGSYFVNSLPIVSDSGIGNGYVRIYYVITGYDSTFTYSWSNGETTINATGLSAGTYSLTVSNSNGCSATTSVTITQPNILGISANIIANVNCNAGSNGSASSNATGGISPYTYLWSDTNSQTTIIATGLSAGTYIVNVIDSNGCTASASVIISQPIAISPTITEYSGVKCNGDSDAVLFARASGGSGFYQYHWSDASGQTNSLATGLSIGTYSVTVTDNNGCTGTASAIITQPSLLNIITDSINATNGNCNGSAWVIVNGGTNPYSYLWSGGLTTDTIFNQCTNYYCCTITDSHGCVDSACITIDVSTGANQLTINNGQLTIYPNPNNGIFTLQIDNGQWTMGNDKPQVKIYNILGEQIYSQLSIVHFPLSINLSSQANGMYFYRVISENGGLIGEGKIIIVR